jgi:hypothetical protein
MNTGAMESLKLVENVDEDARRGGWWLSHFLEIFT